MHITTITMPSVTHAFKARSVFSRLGYNCEIRKSPRVSERGCTHVLRVYGDYGEVCAVLKRSGLEYGKVTDER